MARRDLSQRDYTEHATGQLETVLRRQVDETKPQVPTVTPEEAMREARVLQHQSSRDVTRVLFISRNTELLNPTKQSLDGYLNISDVFDEVHLLILRPGIAPRRPVIRPEKNVFMYIVATRYWWQLPIAGADMIKNQLVFADGFRPDLIVARDPFESAVVALWAGRKFARPTQLHVVRNIFHPAFAAAARANRWRRLLARYTIGRFRSVRAATGKLLQQLESRVDATDVAQLPQLNPYESLGRRERTLDLKQKYPQYVFTMLYVGVLDDPQAAFAAIDAARYMLRNPKVALIIFGDGPARAECARRAKLLGIEQQVIFEHRAPDHVPYLQAADLLLVTNTDAFAEELVLQAAGVGIPMVMVRTDRRDDLFTHRESAYLCAPDDVQAPSDGVHELLNDYGLRRQLSEQAFMVVQQAFHTDPEQYRLEYRASIEAALFADEASAGDGAPADTEASEPAA